MLRAFDLPSVLPLLSLLLGLAGSLPLSARADEAGLALMRSMEAGMASDGEDLSVTMQLVRPGGAIETRTFRMWSLTDEGHKALIRFDGPANLAGTALLMVRRESGASDQWLYLPSLGKARRIAPQDKKDSFVGSQFTIEDMTVSVDPDRRVYSVLGDVPCGDGARCTQVEDRPADDAAAKASGYGRVVLYLDQERHVAWRIDFYDKAGGLLKVMTAEGLVAVGDRWRFDKATVTDVATGASTIMTVTARRAGGVTDDLFAPSALGRG